MALFLEMVSFSESTIATTILEAIEKILIYFSNSFQDPELTSFVRKVEKIDFKFILDQSYNNPNQRVSEFAGYLLEQYFEN